MAFRINRLIWDLETSPNVVLSWRVGYKINIDHDNLLKERAIICIGYKWEGSDKVYALTWDKNQCDREMLRKFLEVCEQADEMVAHNGDGFDLPWLKSRCVFHGLSTFPTYKTVDTLQWAKRKFYFNSNRLDYIAKFLGLGGKIKTEFGLWKRIVLDKDAAALKSMVTYCKRDVALLEQVYQKLAPHVQHKTHVGALNGADKWTSPFTGGTNVMVKQKRVTAAGTVQHQFQCLDTGRYYTVSDTTKRLYLEWRKKLKPSG
jgi:hypothetical protein